MQLPALFNFSSYCLTFEFTGNCSKFFWICAMRIETSLFTRSTWQWCHTLWWYRKSFDIKVRYSWQCARFGLTLSLRGGDWGSSTLSILIYFDSFLIEYRWAHRWIMFCHSFPIVRRRIQVTQIFTRGHLQKGRLCVFRARHQLSIFKLRDILRDPRVIVWIWKSVRPIPVLRWRWWVVFEHGRTSEGAAILNY